jgi:hypothetical protein
MCLLCTYAYLVCSSARYRIFVVAKTSFEVVLERETTVYCTNFLNEVKTQDEILLVRSDIEVEVEQINMADYLVISEERQKLISKVTKQDKTLEQLIKVIEQGWDTSYIPNDLNLYYNVRNELSLFLAQEIAESILGQVKFQMAFSTNGIFRMEFRKYTNCTQAEIEK